MTEPIALDANDQKIGSQIAAACLANIDPHTTIRLVIQSVLEHDWLDEELREALICEMARCTGLDIVPEGDDDGDEDGAGDAIGDPWRDRDD